MNAFYGQFEGAPPEGAEEELAEPLEAETEVEGEGLLENESAAEPEPQLAAAETGEASHEEASPEVAPEEAEGEVVDAADVHLSYAPSELGGSPHPISSVAKDEFDTIKNSGNAG